MYKQKKRKENTVDVNIIPISDFRIGFSAHSDNLSRLIAITNPYVSFE